ncbi:type II secretion system ATPase GspE [bacterium]|nr:type II secretion system ATPase GspE [bacterium]
MIDLGLLTDEQFQLVRQKQDETGQKFGMTAVALGIITREMLTQALAEQQGMKSITLDPENLKVPPAAIEMVPETMCTLYKIFPVGLEEGVLTIVMADPSNLAALDDLRNMLSVSDVHAVVASEAEVEAAISKTFAGKRESIEDIVRGMEEDEELSAAKGRHGSIDLDSLEEQADAAPVRKLINMVLLMAIRDRASDIHLEPFEDEFRMRYRADGVMMELVPPPRHLAAAISSRVKVMANLDIAERRVPQDGRIELTVGGNPVDLRVSVLPTMFGEAIVMRILDRSVVKLDLNNIGMPQGVLSKFKLLIEKPHGIVLVTGPTGSGKTTTLYSALNLLNTVDTKIITSEDPIEYDIDGIVQAPVNADIGVTFASILRAVLRQDPDIILVGEIRDFETAQIAVQSSLTGHLVFSTLHTNDAPSSVTRLMDMGVPPFLLTATIEGILAQRLVRKICQNCRQPYQPSVELLFELGLTPEKIRGKNVYQGRGCDKCNNTGFKGRNGIFELFEIDDEIRQMILDGATRDVLAAAGRKNGMMTLREAGLEAIFTGVTTIEEIVRETVVDDDLK